MESDGSLRVWKGDYGAPSLDSISLQALSYVKFTGAKVRITYGSLPQWAPIPSYRDKLGLCESSSEILQRIKATLSKERDVDDKYYSADSSRIEAYKSYAKDVLEVANEVVFWYTNENYVKVTKPYYYSLILFPFNYFHLKKLTKRHFDNLVLMTSKDLLEEYVIAKMMRAKQCLKDISETLGGKPYILGDRPSSLDAVVYGLLAPIYYAPLEKCDFQNKLKSYPNLTRFITNITRSQFPDIKYNPQPPVKDDDTDRAPWWEIALAGLTAFTITCWFAYAKGLVRIVP